MKKLSRLQRLLLVAALAMLAASGYCIYVIVQQASAESELEVQINKVNLEISKIAGQYNMEALEAEIEELEQQVNDAAFPEITDVVNNEVHDLVINAEHSANVKVLSFIPGRETTANLASTGMQFRVKPYAIGATAVELSQLYDFLGQIESNALLIPYESLVVNDVAFLYAPVSEEQPSYWEMNITVVVYTQ